MKSKKGLTLVEVLVAFVIISLLSVMIVPVFAQQLRFLDQTRKITNDSFNEQGDLENKVRKVEALIKEWYQLKRFIDTASDPVKKNAAIARQTAVKGELDSYPHTVEVVQAGSSAKNVTLYKVEVKQKGPDGSEVGSLVAWVADREPKEFATPLVDKVTIWIPGSDLADVGQALAFFAEGKKVESKVTYSKHGNLVVHTVNEWFVARPGFHVLLPEGRKVEESESGTLYPAFSGSYEQLISEQSAVLSKIKKEYLGRMMVSAVTPGTKEGKKGERTPSHFMYISPLPAYPAGLYDLVVDASLKINPNESVYQPEVLDDLGGPGKLVRADVNHSLKFIGSIDETGKVLYNGNLIPTFTRFFTFTPTSGYKVVPRAYREGYTVFVVGKVLNADASPVMLSADMGDSVYLSMESQGVRFGKGADVAQAFVPGAGDDKWHVWSVAVSGRQLSFQKDGEPEVTASITGTTLPKGIQLGGSLDPSRQGARMEVAELIVLGSGEFDKKDAIQKVLVEKYGLENKTPTPTP